ncbi:hypothetical protein [Acrocarpospora sp. B8E8]|uniref:hypothetical protein n=1 Tax=Acrocarpospora sp. B8E8 TaxID=3153572 RepID=UPI00325CAE50
MRSSCRRWTTCNLAANRVSGIAFQHNLQRHYDLRKRVYGQVREEFGVAAQAAQHVIKKVADAYTTLRANIRAGNLGEAGSKRRLKAESKPIGFRPEAAQPFDDRCLSWRIDARTVSVWTLAGRLRGIAFTGSPQQMAMLAKHRKDETDLVRRDGSWFWRTSRASASGYGFASPSGSPCTPGASTS